MSRYHLPFTLVHHSVHWGGGCLALGLDGVCVSGSRWGVCLWVQMGCVSLGLGVYTPWTHTIPLDNPHTSYWNAFLFVYYFCLSCFMCPCLTPSRQFSWRRSTCEVLGATGRYGDLWPMWCVTFKQSASLVTLKVADEFAFAPLLLTYRYLLIIKLHQFVGPMIPLWMIIPAQWTLSAIKIFVLNFIVCLSYSSLPGPFITFIRLTLWRECELCN